MGNYDELKNKYQEGYRCIYKDETDGMTLHLKNFTLEKIHTIHSANDMEIGEMNDFLDQMDKIKKNTCHDCHGTN